ncbi:RNA polymerase sigma-70 factor, ECF subfamily [Pedobacter africanus]|uniref:RNA polymerase sigma-70 factor, ECF subfamily n=2 Tax=Pedobacter africanus TaxID=151894 RepID=A0A1W1YR96_9SPHI|nr:RNA polymerase sigma-70 factor, ECF subfamily [Pedobacter africanus]
MVVYNTLSDGELVVLLKQDDRSAFTEIYNRYWKKLFTTAGQKVFELEEAREIVQNIFISLWERRDSLKIEGSLSAYLSVSVKYRIINSLDKHYIRKKYLDSLPVVSEIDNSTQEWLEFEELKERLSALVADLPEKCRLVFTMSREQGMSQKEIAQELDISEKTVEAHLGKAIKTLKTGLKSFLLSLL